MMWQKETGDGCHIVTILHLTLLIGWQVNRTIIVATRIVCIYTSYTSGNGEMPTVQKSKAIFAKEGKLTFQYMQSIAYMSSTNSIRRFNDGCHQWSSNWLPSHSTWLHTCFLSVRVSVQCFVDHCLSSCHFSFDHCIIFPSILGF